MKRRLLLSLFPAITLGAFAQLSPQTPAPLSRHMREVNAQWVVQDPSPTEGDRIVSFADDAQRIATHLHRVHTTLAARTPEGLSAEQMKARTTLLEDLDRYADRGRFPQNHALPYRNPVFIDPQHTACAVGQLMIESGHEDLALHISDRMNQGYVSELLQAPELGTEIGSWAVAHGFSADELAWIQPAYAPTFNWDALGGGTDASVTTLLKLANNDLLVAGEFTDAGGVSCTRVAVWNGSTYTPLGTGVDGDATCAVEFNGQLYLGGSFQSNSTDHAVWNGTTWTYGNVQNGMAPVVHALHVRSGVLYAASSASGFSGTTEQVFRLVGGNWQPVGQALNGPILALETHEGELVAGGHFTGNQTFGIPDSSIQHVARFDGAAWVQLADGLDGGVNDLLNVGNVHLYAGGELYSNIVPRFGLARLGGGPAWEQLMPNHPSYLTQSVGPTAIHALVAVDTTVWLGGSFHIAQLLTSGSHLARFNGQPDLVEPTALLDAPVNALSMWSSDVVCGGDFTNQQGVPLPYVAFTDLATGIAPAVPLPSLALWPSPADEVLHVDAGTLPFQGEDLVVVDAAGHAVKRITGAQGTRIDIALDDLKTGAYWVRIMQDGQVRTAPFVKR